ncbi:MAG: class I SAM-dependent methyltransferase [Pseudomonadota bacterium]|nr:class I SAM-dependent methyltransferase [Pseudomonadota bacterium]
MALATAGFKAVGVDVSARALALAAETTPQAKLHCANISDFTFASAHTVTTLGDVMCYQIKDGHHALKNNIVLDRIYRVLAPGGNFFRHRGPRPRKPVSIPKSPCRTRLTYQPRRARKPRRGTALSGYCHRSPGQRAMTAVP